MYPPPFDNKGAAVGPAPFSPSTDSTQPTWPSQREYMHVSVRVTYK